MTIPGGFTAGYVVTATDMNLLPAGVEGGGYAETTTATTGVTTSETDVTGLTVTFTAVGARRYRAIVNTEVIDSGSTSAYVLSLKDGATVLHRFTGVNGHAGSSTCQIVYTNNSSISGSKTWKATLVRAGGSGTLQTTNAATYPSFLLIEDIGPL